MLYRVKYFAVLLFTLFALVGCNEEVKNIPHVVPPSICKKTYETPAIIETKTEHLLVTPAKTDAAGKIIQKARYKTQTRQEIISPRKTLEFNAVCPDVLTPGFVTSLQRALAARGAYTAALNGRYDPQTRRAVLKYQSGMGIKSGDLAMITAQEFGLIVAKF